MSKHKKRKGNPKTKPQEKQTTWEIIKDLFRNPFEYRRKSGSLGKVLGGVCLFLAVCLLFYLTGDNF